MLAKDELFLVSDGVELIQGLAWLTTGGHWVHGRSSPGEWIQSTGCHVEFIWFWVDGNVFVETLIDLEDFLFCNFLFSDLSILISDHNGLQQPDQTSSCSTWPDQQLLHKPRDTLPPWSAAWQHLPLTPSITWTSTSASTWSWPSPAWSPPPHPISPQNSSSTWVQCWPAPSAGSCPPPPPWAPSTSFYPPHLTLSPPVPQNFI